MNKEFGLSEIKLKDFKPTHQKLELMLNRYGEEMTMMQIFTMSFGAKLIDYKDAVKKYGDLYVMSVRDYEDTKTTSIILRKYEVS